MTLMRYLLYLSFSLLFIFICAGGAWAQQSKCTLAAAQSPELRGLRLGMTEEQVRARFKVIEAEPVDEFKVERLQLEPGGQMETDAVRDISAELIGQKVVAIRLVYNPAPASKTQEAFADELSRSLKLPSAWKPVSVGSTVTGMVMECAGFKLSANLIGGIIPVVYLSSLEAETTLLRRQAERERRLRDFFKP
jgi:hypothetical protein